MQDLTFGEQVKIVLSRRNMTIKELAKKIEVRTKKKMSRQNLTQRLGRDNFQEQDMRMIAEILGCSFHLDILGDSPSAEKTEMAETVIETVEREEGLEQTEKKLEEVQSEGEAEEKEVSEPKEVLEADSKGDGTEEMESQEMAVVSNERDITIGELVDIHKELDEIMEKATGELPKLEEHLEDGQIEEQPEVAYESAGYGDSDQQIRIQPEETSENDLSVKEGEPIENLLEEIESIEKEEKKEEKVEMQEEKPHGWRAYFKQRFKKKEKDQPERNDEPQAADLPEENPTTESNPTEAEQTGYSYSENIYEESDYTGNDYSENTYLGNEYLEKDYSEVYAENSQDVKYEENLYAETGYLYETPKEEEEEKGERNPYTGKEYESNSVRMHPSRIGYVQVYDRSNHGWTDMTEWAFLGYQERKKQLLGKDYDPPIYLD